jgi:hypothetical protein
MVSLWLYQRPRLVVKLGSETFTLNRAGAGGVVLGSHTILPGSHIISVGTMVSLHADAATMWVNGSPVPIPPALRTTLQLGSETFALRFTGSGIVIGAKTLVAGSSFTISGTALSLSPDMATLVVNGSPLPLPLYPTPQPTPAPQQIVLSHTTLVPDSLTRFTFGTQTLSAGGPAVTWNGTTWSIAVEGGRTVFIFGTVAPSTTTVVAEKTASVLRAVSETGKGESVRTEGSVQPANQKGGGVRRTRIWEERWVGACMFIAWVQTFIR